MKVSYGDIIDRLLDVANYLGMIASHITNSDSRQSYVEILDDINMIIEDIKETRSAGEITGRKV